jgi:beta-glucosidase
MNDQPLYKDATRSVDERVDDLLARMTLAEKVAQLGSYWVYELLDGLALSEAKAQKLLHMGIGQITRVGGASNVRPAQSAALTNSIQRFVIERTRLGIPAVIHEECCSGYMALGATVFPQAIGIASTWEPELVSAMTDVIRAQMRSVGAHHALAPVLDVARDARWGRVEETFGEDPYLVSQMGNAYIKGLQGADWRQGIVATGKHFVGYSMSEGGLNWAPPHLNARELREVYLRPFEAAVKEANLGSIMNGYHELDGVPCGAHKELLTDILRGEWGFDGTVVSDYFAVTMLKDYHRLAPDKADAARQALEAGLDVELPFTDSYGDPLREAVEQGRIPLALVETALRRVLRQKFALGVFEAPYVDEGAVSFDTPDQRALARELARKSIVLLRNEGNLLPLDKGLKDIAVIGPNADMVRHLFGDYAYPAHVETLIEMSKRQANVFNMPLPDVSPEALADFIPAISVLEAISAQVSDGATIRYAQGCGVIGDSTEGFAAAVAAAKAAQLAILVMGDKAGLTDDCTSGEARDRAELSLPGVQRQLVQAVYDTGTPVVLVLINGRPVTLDWMSERIPAIVEAWFPAEEGAAAIAEVLFGAVNPGGKLPITFPRAVGQVPIFYSHKPSGGRSHWKGNYVETSVQPLYPFGYGLSYTTFAFSNLQITPATIPVTGRVRIAVEVTNTGTRAGDEVVQLYTHQYAADVTRPVKELRGFKRVTLSPGERCTVSFDLAAEQLAFFNRSSQQVVEPGTVDVMVGSSSQHIHCTGTFTVAGAVTPVTPRRFSTPASLD